MKRIFCYGDSLTAGFRGHGKSATPYGEFLKKVFGDDVMNVTVSGFNGWTTSSLLDHSIWKQKNSLTEALDTKQYDLFVIMAGTNDLGHKHDAETIFTCLEQMYMLCLENSDNCKILSIGIPDSRFLMHDQSAYKRRQEIADKIQSFEEEHSNRFTFIKCPIEFSEEDDNYMPDGLHFSEFGSRNFAEKIAPTIKSLLQI